MRRSVELGCSWLIVGVLTNSSFELLNALGHAHDLLLDGGLFSLQVAHLLLKSGRLGAHLPVVACDLLVNAVQLVLKSLACVLALHGQHVFKSLLLGAQDLHFLLVGVQLLVKGTAQLHQVVQFALEVRSVVTASLGRAFVLA